MKGKKSTTAEVLENRGVIRRGCEKRRIPEQSIIYLQYLMLITKSGNLISRKNKTFTNGNYVFGMFGNRD